MEAAYGPTLAGGNSRLEGGATLWGQFTDAVAGYRKRGSAAFAAVYERINELVVAEKLLSDPSLADGRIVYEPPIAGDDRRIDFRVDFHDPKMGGSSLHIEVKTVRPTAKDTDRNWQKYEERSRLHTPNVRYIVQKEWLGAALYGNSFSARSKFMGYARAFEPKLAAAQAARPGRGVLVFCGTGMEWHRSELEDFADFYRTGRHRQDDPFAAMEAEALRSGDAPLLRSIAAFGFLKRPMDNVAAEEWITDLRGPALFQ